MITTPEQLAAALTEPDTSPEHRADWGKYVDHLDKMGLKGSPKLDKNNLGNNLLADYIKNNPGTTLTPNSHFHVQNDQSKQTDETSVVDGLHSNATQIKFDSGDPIGKKRPAYDMGAEMKDNASKNLQFDKKPATEVVRSAAKKTGINPALLLSSAWGEGMNRAVMKPDDISIAYTEKMKGKDAEDFPVDGFYNYGLDRFGDNYASLKKYLPAGFESQFKTFDTTNEKNEPIKTAAFKTNEGALMAKSAMLRQAQDQVDSYAKDKGVALDQEAKDYFTLASYNAGFSNGKKMMDEYISSADKKNFIGKGLTSRQGVHKNISSRMKNMAIANDLLK